jgi:hypothetical protein
MHREEAIRVVDELFRSKLLERAQRAHLLMRNQYFDSLDAHGAIRARLVRTGLDHGHGIVDLKAIDRYLHCLGDELDAYARRYSKDAFGAWLKWTTT